MAAEPGTATATAVIAAQGAIAGAAGMASPFMLHFVDYGMASLFAVIGIVARHAFDASKTRTFDLRAFSFDLPTAPFLGIVAYVFTVWMQLAEYVIPLIVIMLGFLGPEWIRSLGDGIRTLVLNRLGGKNGGA